MSACSHDFDEAGQCVRCKRYEVDIRRDVSDEPHPLRNQAVVRYDYDPMIDASLHDIIPTMAHADIFYDATAIKPDAYMVPFRFDPRIKEVQGIPLIRGTRYACVFFTPKPEEGLHDHQAQATTGDDAAGV